MFRARSFKSTAMCEQIQNHTVKLAIKNQTSTTRLIGNSPLIFDELPFHRTHHNSWLTFDQLSQTRAVMQLHSHVGMDLHNYILMHDDLVMHRDLGTWVYTHGRVHHTDVRLQHVCRLSSETWCILHPTSTRETIAHVQVGTCSSECCPKPTESLRCTSGYRTCTFGTVYRMRSNGRFFSS
jgi:hypothetical protein